MPAPPPFDPIPGMVVIEFPRKGVCMKRLFLLFLLLAPALMAAQRQVFLETIGEEW